MVSIVTLVLNSSSTLVFDSSWLRSLVILALCYLFLDGLFISAWVGASLGGTVSNSSDPWRGCTLNGSALLGTASFPSLVLGLVQLVVLVQSGWRRSDPPIGLVCAVLLHGLLKHVLMYRLPHSQLHLIGGSDRHLASSM